MPVAAVTWLELEDITETDTSPQRHSHGVPKESELRDKADLLGGCVARAGQWGAMPESRGQSRQALGVTRPHSPDGTVKKNTGLGK